jgi:hypothetical protein
MRIYLCNYCQKRITPANGDPIRIRVTAEYFSCEDHLVANTEHADYHMICWDRAKMKRHPNEPEELANDYRLLEHHTGEEPG